MLKWPGINLNTDVCQRLSEENLWDTGAGIL